MLYEELASASRCSRQEAITLIQQCSLSNGVISVPKVDNFYSVYRFFLKLIEDAEIPVRKPAAIHFEVSREQTTVGLSFDRSTGVKENTLALIRNLPKLIFPSKLEYHILKLEGVSGRVTTGEHVFTGNSRQVVPLNNVYLFTSDRPVDLTIQTYLAKGMRSMETNAQSIFSPHYMPIMSQHTLWDHVRITGYNEAKSEIYYTLTNFRESGFLEIMDAFRFRDGRPIQAEEQSKENETYASKPYWMHLVMEMQISLNFKPADKRGWTAIVQSYPNIRSLQDFEDTFFKNTTRAEAIIALSSISRVSYQLAEKIVNYLEPKLKGEFK